MALRRYLAMDGKMGYCPDWYRVLQAARYLNVPPWELMEQSIWWQSIANMAMDAEAAAVKIKQGHK